MKWTIHQLYQLQNKGLTFDEVVDGAEFVNSDPQIRHMSEVNVKGRADISSSKVTFHLKISGEMTLPCARTLVDVLYPFEINATETFLLNVNADYEEDAEIRIVEGEVVDLKPLIEELIIVEIPMQVFSGDQQTAGAAPQSGKDWEVVTEEEQNNKVDPRLAVLENFFKNKEK
ncbi:DUF177 domain-containing protein [Priestia megaterium]|nr:DUF177 domain-containing protein [Priestia megaterium]